MFSANSTKCTIRLVKILYMVARSQTPHFIIFLRHPAHCVILLKHSLCLRKANCVNSAKAESLFQRQIRLCTSSCFSTRSVLRYRFEAFLHSRVLPSAKAESSRRAKILHFGRYFKHPLETHFRCDLHNPSAVNARKKGQQKLIVSTVAQQIHSVRQKQFDVIQFTSASRPICRQCTPILL